jgi:hypothetical protein
VIGTIECRGARSVVRKMTISENYEGSVTPIRSYISIFSRGTDIWAKYGGSHQKAEYGLLRQVTYWKAESVQEEKVLSIGDVNPTYVLKNSFAELLDLFEFKPFESRSTRDSAIERA